MNKLMKRFTQVLLALLYVSGSVLYASEAMVISVIGDASVRSAGDAAWQPLARGAKLLSGQELKTGNDSLVRAITEDGELKVYDANMQVRFGDETVQAAEKSVVATLGEFVAGSARSRVAATRDLGAGRQEKAQQDWLRYMQQPPGLEEMENFLDLIYYYEKIDQPERRWALMARAAEDKNTYKGFSKLAANFDPLDPLETKLALSVSKDGISGSEVTSEGEVNHGNGINISIDINKDSFAYVFFTSQPESGIPQTFMLSPDNLGTRPNRAGVEEFAGLIWRSNRLHLPAANQFYQLDDTVGVEHIWGWACPGPVTDQAAIDDAIAQIHHVLRSGVGDVSAAISQQLPAVCSTPFYSMLNHR